MVTKIDMTIEELRQKLTDEKIFLKNGRINSKYEHLLKKKQAVLDELLLFYQHISNISIKEALILLKTNKSNRPLCNTCKKELKLVKLKYARFCSTKCSKLDKNVQDKFKKTNLERYGVEHALQNNKIKEKTKQTIFERFGVENISQNKEVKEKTKKTNLERYGGQPAKNIEIKNKIKKTNLERYGVEYGLQNEVIKEKIKQTNLESYGFEYITQNKEVKEKIKQTNLERYGGHSSHIKEVKEKLKQTNLKKYGTVYGFQNKEIKEKIKQTNLEKYGVEYITQNKEVKEKIKQTILEKYDVEYVSQSNEIKEKIKQTNLEKYGVEYFSQKHLSQEILNTLNNKHWLIYQHHVLQKTLNQIAHELNVDVTTISNYFKKHNIVVIYFLFSTREKELVDFLISLNVTNIITNTRKIINPKELDIYLPDYNLAIEFNGLYWHSEAQGKDKNYHVYKHNLCKEKEIRLITIFEDEWIYRQQQVKSKLKSILCKDDRGKIFARKTKIISLSKSQKSSFFEQNHIQGDGPGSISYGLEYNNEMVATITFIKQKNGKFVLNRYATAKQVPGGFSKLLEHFKRNNDWEEIITFADLRWSEGELYEKCGFKLDKILKPDYEYVEGTKRVHKFNYRHKNLKNKLNEYNPNLSEKENCEKNNVLRIWDCGKKRYVIKK